MRPYNPLIVDDAYTNCSFMDYSGGWTPGMAPHIIDLPVWALDLGFPTVTFSSGGRYTIRDAGDARTRRRSSGSIRDFTMTWMLSLVNSFGFDFGRRASPRGGWASTSTASTARCTATTACTRSCPRATG